MPIYSSTPLAGLTIKLNIVKAKDLVAKDKTLFGKKKASDPFIRIFVDGEKVGYTDTKFKTVNPEWEQELEFNFGADQVDKIVKNNKPIELRIFDKDRISFSDPMGVVKIPLDSPSFEPEWRDVEPDKCENATGQVLVGAQILSRKYLSMEPGQLHAINHDRVRVSLAWDMDSGGWKGMKTDLDVACVAVDKFGKVHMKDCVYYGNLQNSSHSIRHSGDDTTGSGGGDDERISLNMRQIPNEIYALYFVLSAAKHEQSLSSMQKAEMKLVDESTGIGICRYTNSDFGGNSSFFLMRLARNLETGHWFLAPIGQGDDFAHDFGTLIPNVKAYTRDMIPSELDPYGRMAVMRKEGVIRVKDYIKFFPSNLTFALKWDVEKPPPPAEDEEPAPPVDLDASVILLDSNLRLIKVISKKNRETQGGEIRHCGDEDDGDKAGDDERIRMYLNEVDSRVEHIVLVVTSANGQPLDSVKAASCRLFASGKEKKDLALFNMERAKELHGRTGFLVGSLYRGGSNDEDWNFRVISEAADGTTPEEFPNRIPPGRDTVTNTDAYPRRLRH